MTLGDGSRHGLCRGFKPQPSRVGLGGFRAEFQAQRESGGRGWKPDLSRSRAVRQVPAATCWWRCGYQPAFCSVTVGRGGEGSTWRGREAEPPQAWRCQGLGGWQPQSGCKELVLRLHVVSASALWHGVQLLELQSLGPSEPLTPSLPEPLLLKASPCCQNLP